MLTARGFAALGGVMFGPLVGLLSDWEWPSALALTLFYLFALILLLYRDWTTTRKVASNLEVTGYLPARLFSAVPNKLEIELDLPPLVRSLELSVRAEFPAGVSRVGADDMLLALPGGTTHRLEFAFKPLARGPLRIATMWLRLRGLSGLFRFQLSVPFRPELTATVYPNPFCNPERGQESVHSFSAGTNPFIRGGEGREFDSLRQFAPGDDLRRVDWKRSARRGSLIVKLYRPETHQRVNIVLDCSRRMGNLIGDRPQLDYAADAAAYLMRLAIENDDEVGLLAFDDRMLAQIDCRRGRRQESLILDTLVKLQPGEREGDYDLVRHWGLRRTRRSLLVLLTSVTTPANLENLRRNLLPLAGKHLPLVVAIYDRDLQRILESPVKSADEAFIVGAGQEQLEAIQRRVTVLRQSGIECLYSDVLDIPGLLRRKYYQLKVEGRL